MKKIRQNEIQAYIDEHKMVKIQDLLSHFLISNATLNRDLTDLERTGSIKKIHGGVISKYYQATYEPIQQEKELSEKEYKQEIARIAVKFIKNGMTVMLDSGTTSLALAYAMNAESNIRDVIVVTNDIKVGYTLASNPNIRLVMLGGMQRPFVYSLIGSITESSLENINADILFLSADAIQIERGISNANFDELPVKQKMIARADRIILIADYSKFNHVKVAKVCDLEDIDVFITDQRIASDQDYLQLQSKVKQLVYMGKING